MPTESLYTRQGDVFTASPLTGGPWDPAMQHGGPPSALLAWAIEHFESEVPMQVTRLTAELLRPIPIAPLRLTVRLTHSGRRVQRVEAALLREDTEVARAIGLRIRKAEVDLPPLPCNDEGLPNPAELTPLERRGFGFLEAAELRFVYGDFDQPGPGAAWIRLLCPLLPDDKPSGLVRAVAAADFANGIGRVLNSREYTFPNADLNIFLYREPIGEWIGVATTARMGNQGAGLTDSLLYDQQGVVGRAVQCLVVERQKGARLRGWRGRSSSVTNRARTTLSQVGCLSLTVRARLHYVTQQTAGEQHR